MPIRIEGWDTFYVITGGAAGALTGLMFVVIALAADLLVREPGDGLGAFSTPTVGHFANALVLSAIMSVPIHRSWSLGALLAACGVVGFVFSFRAGRQMRRMAGYTPDRSDFWWHAILPCIAYVALVAAAILVGTDLELALAGVAVIVLGLLLIGIRNAWDVAVYLVIDSIRGRQRKPGPS